MPELAQFILQVVGLGQWGIEFQRTIQAFFLIFSGSIVEVLGVFEQLPARTFQDFELKKIAVFAPKRPASFAEIVVIELHHMQTIKDDSGSGEFSSTALV